MWARVWVGAKQGAWVGASHGVCNVWGRVSFAVAWQSVTQVSSPSAGLTCVTPLGGLRPTGCHTCHKNVPATAALLHFKLTVTGHVLLCPQDMEIAVTKALEQSV